jgi:hypothetical protein
VLGFIVASRAPVAAAPVVYTDKDAWEAAAGGAVLIEDFNAVPVGPLSSTPMPVGALIMTWNGTLPSGAPCGSGASILASGPIDGSRALEASVADPCTMTLTLPQAVTAYGADYASAITGNLLSMTILGDTIHFHDVPLNTGFLGVISGSPFSEVTYSSPFETYQMDNVVTGAKAPEPGTAALLGAGLLLLVRRRTLHI